jgi:DNA modification methylase
MSVIEEKLEGIDWSFDMTTDPRNGLDSLHPYPAKFIPDIPRRLIEVLSPSKHHVIFDPFCGSGTTLAVAQSLGYKSVGVDLNPIACLISKVRTEPFDPQAVQVARRVATHAEDNPEAQNAIIPNVAHWFLPDINSTLQALTKAIDSTEERYKNFLKLALSRIIVRVSNQDSDTRYAAVTKKITSADVPRMFYAAAKSIASALEGRHYELASSTIINSDILALSKEDLPGNVGLVVTSPPYPNAYEYWLYHKYRMHWLGYDPIAVKAKEIGARPHFHGKNAHTEENFRVQIEGVLSLCKSILVAGGYACFVIGNSKIQGRIVDNSAILSEEAKKLGLSLLANISRPISLNKKSFNLLYSRAREEKIMVLQKL